jgi:hypothetical protein
MKPPEESYQTRNNPFVVERPISTHLQDSNMY